MGGSPDAELKAALELEPALLALLAQRCDEAANYESTRAEVRSLAARFLEAAGRPQQ
jgi:hypothetical protein